jgi:hypothetical protein
LDQASIPGLTKGKTLDLAQTKQGWSYTALVPIDLCAQAIGIFAAALDQATSRAKS